MSDNVFHKIIFDQVPVSEIKISIYIERDCDNLLQIWEDAVKSSHHFLTPHHFDLIKKNLQAADLNHYAIYVAKISGKPLGFIAIDQLKIEMLFIAPNFQGQGLGRRLLRFAIEHHHVNTVDVNEQNTNALLFYERSGFVVDFRSDTDGFGMHYPLLHLKYL